MKERLEELLKEAFTKGASDIHLTVGLPPMLRINGELVRFAQVSLKPSDTEGMAKAVIPEPLWERFHKQGELDFSYGIPGLSRFRINTFFQRSCICLAIRVVPTVIPTLSQLNMPLILQQIAKKPQGLVLVTGPTGSGKSTTLAAMIDYINEHEKKHIITLEDPIEYLHKHKKSIVNQREVGFDTLNFANGLKGCLRQDPDIILVGEMRDFETISIALTAAETGHLVLGTLHTTDAPSTIDRIIDVFPPAQQSQIRIQLSAVLAAVISQRLFKTKDGKGRRAATEILINNAAVKNLIRNGKVHQIQNVMQTSRAAGMHTLEMSIRELLEQRVISQEVAAPYIDTGEQ
ncbi:type IV pilus twitching motility protein PilT [Halalkalibacterium ligniniphilum]|uniref:type IV pilus twitching motility protein PilT n=1 Tax=Halalkalibacterium ligniniphilum TaxID=1134413 RepID=UPI0003462361|nr:type IV pilus twitching motility protein PilT [Halalkalibacterium ligniniphilum]